MNKEQILKDISRAIKWRKEWIETFNEECYEPEYEYRRVGARVPEAPIHEKFIFGYEIKTLEKYQYAIRNDVEVNKDGLMDVIEIMNKPKRDKPEKTCHSEACPWWKFW